MTTSTLMAVIFWFITAAVSGAAAYFGSYFRKKGENLATHEDIDKLVEQVAAVTTTTKGIEAKISSDLWDRQKQWELKRDILFDAVKRLNDVDAKLLALNTFWEHKINGKIDSAESEIRLSHDYTTAWLTAMHGFEEVEALTQVTCSPETMTAFAQLGALLKRLSSDIVNGNELAYKLSQKERDKLFGLAKVAIRRELGIPITVIPLTSGSSTEVLGK
jgi:hypothetical protein